MDAALYQSSRAAGEYERSRLMEGVEKEIKPLKEIKADIEILAIVKCPIRRPLYWAQEAYQQTLALTVRQKNGTNDYL